MRDRSASTAALVVMAVVLFLVSSVLFLRGVSDFMLAELQDRIDISTYFKATTSEEDILQIKEELLSLPEVKSVEYVSKKEALELFAPVPAIAQKLQTIHAVGLGYLELGQSATTLSGGEAQRIKLAKELARRATGRTLYLLDEPTTGLHFADVEKLLSVLRQLVDHGNTVVVIEHNLEVVKTADYIIDLGPEGGEGGGRLVAAGSPETVAATPGSWTGQALRPLLNGRRGSRTLLTAGGSRRVERQVPRV